MRAPSPQLLYNQIRSCSSGGMRGIALPLANRNLTASALFSTCMPNLKQIRKCLPPPMAALVEDDVFMAEHDTLPQAPALWYFPCRSISLSSVGVLLAIIIADAKKEIVCDNKSCRVARIPYFTDPNPMFIHEYMNQGRTSAPNPQNSMSDPRARHRHKSTQVKW